MQSALKVGASRQIGEGAVDHRRGGIADRGEDLTRGQLLVRPADEVKPGADSTAISSVLRSSWRLAFFPRGDSGVLSGHGFLLSNSSFTTIVVPGAAETFAYGINRRGVIVGEFTDSAGKYYGFVLRNGKFVTIDVAGAIGTDAHGIDPRGDTIVGNFQDSSFNVHGYLLSR